MAKEIQNKVHLPKRNSPERAKMLSLRREEQLRRGTDLSYNPTNRVQSREYYREAMKLKKIGE
jgi:hypothetical protein